MQTARVTVLAIILALVWADPIGRAQNALDSSLQVGSGGINQGQAPGHGNDFSGHNNIVSGVVGGGREFRSAISDLRDHGKTTNEFGEIIDDLGQGGPRQWRSGHLVAPGAFRDELGTDELFRFRARSLSVDYVNTPQDYTLGFQPVYSGGGTVSGGDVYRAVNRRRDGIAERFWVQRRDAAEGYPEMPFFVPPTTLSRSHQHDSDMGKLQLETGQIVEMDATPLRGLRMTPTTDTSASGRAEEESLLPEAAGSDIDPAGTLDDSLESTQLKNTALEIGQLIVASLDTRYAEASEDPEQFHQLISQKAIDLEQTLFGPQLAEDSDADFYQQLITRIEADRETSEAAADEEELPDEAPPPPNSPEASVQRKVDFLLRNPTALQMQAAEEERRLALQVALGQEDEDQLTPAEDSELDGSLAELVHRLQTQLPLLPTMAGEVDQRVSELFQEAELHMAAGKYFRAEQAYRQILEYRPKHKLAGAGLVHAQLGAGMIRSAAFNIRKLFSQHPQVITLRYEAQLLPNPQRLAWAQQSIETMLEAVNLPEPAIVLAYLGYQTGTPKVIRYGLDVAQARDPEDPLIPLLRRIWIDPSVVEEAPAATAVSDGTPEIPLDEPPPPDAHNVDPDTVDPDAIGPDAVDSDVDTEEAETPLDMDPMPAGDQDIIEATPAETDDEPLDLDDSSNGENGTK